ncbi:MAG: hypothetical protein V1267_10120, partial [Alphaproteobacteria bacterium]|nr:hypothetical protein [Alphaproteobacteria bacterium]
MGQKTAATQAFVASSQAGNASMCITQGDKQLGVCDGESKNEVEGGSYTALKLAVLRQDGAPTGMYRTIGLASVPAGVQVEVAAEVDPIAGLLEEIAAEVAAEAAAAGDTVASEAPTTVDIAIGGFSAGSSVVVETTTEVAPAAADEAAVEEAAVEKAPTLVVDEAANFAVSADAGADVAVAAGPLKVDMAVTEGQDFSFEVDETGQASIGVADTETGETVFEAEADTSGDMGGAAVVGLSFEQDDAGDFEQSTSSTIVTDEGITNEVEDAAGNTMRITETSEGGVTAEFEDATGNVMQLDAEVLLGPQEEAQDEGGTPGPGGDAGGIGGDATGAGEGDFGGMGGEGGFGEMFGGGGGFDMGSMATVFDEHFGAMGEEGGPLMPGGLVEFDPTNDVGMFMDMMMTSVDPFGGGEGPDPMAV